MRTSGWLFANPTIARDIKLIIESSERRSVIILILTGPSLLTFVFLPPLVSMKHCRCWIEFSATKCDTNSKVDHRWIDSEEDHRRIDSEEDHRCIDSEEDHHRINSEEDHHREISRTCHTTLDKAIKHLPNGVPTDHCRNQPTLDHSRTNSCRNCDKNNSNVICRRPGSQIEICRCLTESALERCRCYHVNPNQSCPDSNCRPGEVSRGNSRHTEHHWSSFSEDNYLKRPQTISSSYQSRQCQKSPVTQQCPIVSDMGYLLLLSLLVLSLPQQVQSKGIFEFHIFKVNESFFDTLPTIPKQCCPSSRHLAANGTSADCAWANCRVRLRLCLTIAYKEGTGEPFCAYDQLLSKPFSTKTLHSSADLNFQLMVNARWQLQFALVIDMLAVSGTNDSVGTKILRRVIRSTKALLPGKHWLTFPSLPPIQYSYRFVCFEHFYGEGCIKKCQARDGLHGHYSCSSEGRRICHAGWSGPYCTFAECQGGCGAQGRCVKPNLCTCDPGWTGTRCEKCIPHPGCQNGSCAVRDGVHTPFSCKCHHGWGGMFCNIDLNFCTNHPNPCKNGGKCFNKQSRETNLQYTCQCKSEEYQGTHCEKLVADCHVNHCNRRGKCEHKISADGGTKWQCRCHPPFYGDRCQFNQTTCADHPCQAIDAKCVDDPIDGFKCHCPVGLKGKNCEINEDDCKENPCQNDGKCVDDIGGYKCICPVGFAGIRCQINKDECEKMSCMNSGRCVDMANSVKCSCKPGFSGSFCQINIDECQAKPCENGGVCYDKVNDYVCQCPANFTGKNCHISIRDPCSISPCVHGRCRPHNSTDLPFTCDCPTNFRGHLCELEQPNITSERPMFPAPDPTDFHFSPLEVALIVSIGISLPLVTILFAILLCVCRRRGNKKRYCGKELGMLRHPAIHEIRNDLNSARHPPGTGCHPQPLLAVRKVHNTDRPINYKHIPPPPLTTVAIPVAAKLAHLEGIDNCSLTGDDGLASSCNSSMMEKVKEMSFSSPNPPPPAPPPPPYIQRKSPDGSADKEAHSEEEPLRRSSTHSLRNRDSVYSVDVRDNPVQCNQPGFLQDLLSSQQTTDNPAALDLAQAGLWHDFQVTEV